ncbi:hypothetical protein F5Y15DRAFT_370224 [Xylariaceae sp. FL0016]|nr:hypothetical protein F5Y15DRAFT_370224 [Xylariaceae sp. FL0016]
MDALDNTLDETTLTTISMLEDRISRLENLLYGHSETVSEVPAVRSLQELERRFSKLLQRLRIYADLLKLYKSHPTLFQPPPPTQPPPDLSPESLRALVLAAAPSFPSTASALTSVADTPVPDAALSASLTTLLPRMKGVEATQLAQAAEVADLRAQSEEVVRQWYAFDVAGYAEYVGLVEDRIERVDHAVRRAQKAREKV